MKFGIKEIAAAAAAVVMTASLCGCGDTGYIMTVDGMEISNGLYLFCERSAISRANTEITEERREYGDTSEPEDIFKETVDGENAVEWIKRETLNEVKRTVAVRRLCEQNGISLTAEQISSLNDELNSMWNDESGYAQYFYQMDTVGEYYDSIGIGKESLRELYTADDLSSALFLHYYDIDGVTPVTDEEFNGYIKENYATAKIIELEYKDYQGLMLKTDEEIQAVKDLAQSYAERINNGESAVDINYEVELQNARNDARVDAEDAYGEMEEEERPENYDAYIQEKMDAVTVEKKTAEQLDTVIGREGASLDAELAEYIWNSADNGRAAVLETESSSYIVIREDITSKEEWKENVRVNVLNALKSDEYEEMLKAAYADYSVEQDDYLVNKKYSPEKIK